MEQLAAKSTYDSLCGKSVVNVEDAVLSGEQCVYHVLRKLVECYDFALFIACKFSYIFSIYIEKTRRKGRLKVSEVFGVFCIFCSGKSFAQQYAATNCIDL